MHNLSRFPNCEDQNAQWENANIQQIPRWIIAIVIFFYSFTGLVTLVGTEGPDGDTAGTWSGSLTTIGGCDATT
jgi:hypothetical protein